MTGTLKASLAALAIGAAAIVAFVLLPQNGEGLPAGFVQGNGRVEAEQVDIASVMPGRVSTVHAAEGSMVAQGDVLVEMDTDELSAALDRARAEAALAR